MRVSIQVANFTWPGGDAAIAPALRTIGQAADHAGLDTVWVMDHFFQLEPMLGPADSPMLESNTTLSYLAGITERVRLGTLVTGVHYRPARLLAKTVTTLDVLSGGRAWLGIGAGWYERESTGLGFPVPPDRAAVRAARGDPPDRPSDVGRRPHPHRWRPLPARRADQQPQALAEPRPRILIGGGGERKTLRMVAQYADACNLFAFAGPHQLRRKLDVLKAHCDELGRGHGEISKSIGGLQYTGQPAKDIVPLVRPLADLGFDHVIFNDHLGTPVAHLGAEVVPALAELSDVPAGIARSWWGGLVVAVDTGRPEQPPRQTHDQQRHTCWCGSC